MRRDRRWLGAALPLAAAAVIIVAAAVNELRLPLNGDAHWILTMAGRLLDGERLYRDILEINPPLIVWLQLPIVWLARALGVAPALVYRLAVFAGAIGSTLATCSLLARTSFAAGQVAQRWAAPVILLALLLVPAGAFGQREQIITMLLLPAIVLTALRVECAAIRTGTAVACGVAAGLAIALKPYFIVVWLALAGYRSVTRRRIGVEREDVAIILVGVAYVASVFLFTPAFLDVVRTFGSAYVAFTPRQSVGALLDNAATIWLAAALVAWVVRSGGRPNPTGMSLALAAAASFLAALFQGKGWTYHFLPSVILAVLLGAAAVASRTKPRSAVMGMSQAVAAVLLLLSWVPLGQRTIGRFRRDTSAEASRLARLSAAVASETGAESILILSADMTSALPWVADRRLRAHSSFPYLWVPAVVYHTRWNGNPQVAVRGRESMAKAERSAYDAVVSDFVAHTPDVLVVESRARNEQLTGYPGGFDHLEYYGADPVFARCLREYHVEVAMHDYQILRRQPAGARQRSCADGG